MENKRRNTSKERFKEAYGNDCNGRWYRGNVNQNEEYGKIEERNKNRRDRRNEATTASRRTEGIEIKYNKQNERTKGKIEELCIEGIGKERIWHHVTSILVFFHFVSLLYFIRHYFIVA